MQYLGKDSLLFSPLNFAGNKKKLLPYLLPLFPNKERFFDLFTGGLTVALNVDSQKIIANDLDTNLISIYKMFQSYANPDILIQDIYTRIKKHGLFLEVSTDQEVLKAKENYLTYRSYYDKTRDPLDLFVILCFSYNNFLRFNQKNELTTTFHYGLKKGEVLLKKFNVATEQKLKSMYKKLPQLQLQNKSYLDFEAELTTQDFVYLDPPYLLTEVAYNRKTSWQEKHLNELFEFLYRLNNKQIKWGLSEVLLHKNKENTLVKEFAKDFNLFTSYKDYQTVNNNNASTKNIDLSIECYVYN